MRLIGLVVPGDGVGKDADVGVVDAAGIVAGAGDKKIELRKQAGFVVSRVAGKVTKEVAMRKGRRSGEGIVISVFDVVEVEGQFACVLSE